MPLTLRRLWTHFLKRSLWIGRRVSSPLLTEEFRWRQAASALHSNSQSVKVLDTTCRNGPQAEPVGACLASKISCYRAHGAYKPVRVWLVVAPSPTRDPRPVASV